MKFLLFLTRRNINELVRFFFKKDNPSKIGNNNSPILSYIFSQYKSRNSTIISSSIILFFVCFSLNQYLYEEEVHIWNRSDVTQLESAGIIDASRRVAISRSDEWLRSYGIH